MGKALACTAMTKSRITRLLPAGFWARCRLLRGPQPVTAERACPVGFPSVATTILAASAAERTRRSDRVQA